MDGNTWNWSSVLRPEAELQTSPNRVGGAKPKGARESGHGVPSRARGPGAVGATPPARGWRATPYAAWNQRPRLAERLGSIREG